MLLLLIGKDVETHVCEFGFVDFDLVVAEALACLWFCETDCAYFRVGKDYSRDIIVGEFGGLEFWGSEQTAAELAAGGDGDFSR